MAKLKNKYTSEVFELLNKMPALAEELEDNLSLITSKMDSLKKAGLYYATMHWRKDNNQNPKYLILLHKKQRGEDRKREYIGADPALIKAAEEGIKRAKEYDALNEEKKTLVRRLNVITESLQKAERSFSSEYFYY